jgi:hypothetical protein
VLVGHVIWLGSRIRSPRRRCVGLGEEACLAGLGDRWRPLAPVEQERRVWQLTRPADVVVMQVGEHDRPDRIRLNAARTRLRNDVLTTSDPGDSTRQHLPTAASPGGWTRREFPHCSVLRESVYVLDRMTDVVSLAEAAGRDVARVLTNAFVDDPGWRDVGPNRARHRRLALWAYHRVASLNCCKSEAVTATA